MAAGLKVLLRHAKSHWRIGVLAAFGMLLEAGVAGLFTYLMKHMIDDVFVDKDPIVTRWLPWVILALFAVRALGVYIGDLGAARIARSIVRDVRERCFAHYLRLPTAFFQRSQPGPLLSKLTVEIEQLGHACTEGFKIILADSLLIIGMLISMLLISVKLTLMVLIAGPIIGLIVGAVAKRFKRLNRGVQDSLAEVTNRAQAVISGDREVKIFGAQATELLQFQRANAQNYRQQLKITATNALSTSIVQFLAAGALAGVIFVAARGIGGVQAMTPGQFMTFISSMLFILPSLKRLTNVQNVIARGVSADTSIAELLQVEPERDQGQALLPDGPIAIELKQVSVRYDKADALALDQINLQIPAAQVIALVGRSGGGKTTLANLIPRFVSHTEGEVLLAGQAVESLQLKALRKHIGWVGQQVVLNADTVIGNVAYGQDAALSTCAISTLQATPRATDGNVWRALEQANAADFVRAMPDQLHANIGHNGQLLSGGQRQRLALARALYKTPGLLILDEATSALDNETERAVQTALQSLRGKTTLLVIAHRLSTIENADQIVVLDAGRIVEKGTHIELLQQAGLYAQLHQRKLADDNEL